MTHLPSSTPDQTNRLTATQWRDVEALLPAPNVRGRPYADRRSVIDGVIWQYVTACPWRTVPRRYAPWQTCYHYRRELDRMGLWGVIVTLLALKPAVTPGWRQETQAGPACSPVRAPGELPDHSN